MKQDENEQADDGFELLDSLVGYNLRRAAAHQRERFRKAFAPYDIRPVQLTALIIIFHNDAIGQSALGRMLGMKRANVVTLLDELQQRSLLRRRQSKIDKRAYNVHLTAKGKRLTEELLSVHEKLEGDLAQSFGCDELRDLVDLLRRFRKVRL